MFNKLHYWQFIVWIYVLKWMNILLGLFPACLHKQAALITIVPYLPEKKLL